MGGNKRLGIIAYILLAIAFTIYAIISNNKAPEISYDNRVPPPPSERYDDKYWQWSSGNQSWELKSYRYDRAIAPKKTRTDGGFLTEEDLEKHLEDHVDGYLEDNYWGEYPE